MPRRKIRWLGAVFAILALVAVDIVKVSNVVATQVQTDIAKVVKAELTDQEGTILTSSEADTEQSLHLELNLDPTQFNENGFISLELTPTTVVLAQNNQEIIPEINGEKRSDLKIKYGYNESKKSYGLSYDQNQYTTLQDQTIELDFKVPVTTGSKNINSDGDQINLQIGGNQDPHLIGSMVIKMTSESSFESQASSESQGSEGSVTKAESVDEDGESDTEVTKKSEKTESKADKDKAENKGLTTDPSEGLSGSVNAYQTTIDQSIFSDMNIYSKNANEKDKTVNVTGEKSNPGSLSNADQIRSNYYTSYQAGGSSKAVMYGANTNNTNIAGERLVVDYSHVGTYQSATGYHDMGAMLVITNIQPGTRSTGWTSSDIFIDFSNNFFSGLTYGQVHQFDVDVIYYDADTKAKLNIQKDSDDGSNSFMTFGSLNGNRDGNEFAGTREKHTSILSTGSLVTDNDDGWYEGKGTGIWDGSEDWTQNGYFGDFLGSSNFEKSAVSFVLEGETNQFMLKSDYGFTWQSFASGSLEPMKPGKPSKTVTTNPNYDKNNELDITQAGQGHVTVNDIDDHYYFIYQPTFKIPESTIAKPNEIVLTDLLPKGVILKENSDIVLFNTDGEEIKVKSGTLKDEMVGGSQDVTYELSTEQIEAIKFDGGEFAFRLNVSVDQGNKPNEGQEPFQMPNTANVAFNSGGKHNYSDNTNTVITQLTPNEAFGISKVGERLSEPGELDNLVGVTFDVREAGSGSGAKVETDNNGWAKLDDLIAGKTYVITEMSTVNGYVKLTEEIKFKVENNKLVIVDDPAGAASVTGDGLSIKIVNKLQLGDANFVKIDERTKEKLEGAQFAIAKDEAKSAYALLDDDHKFIRWTDRIQDATKVTSDKNGEFKVSGLPYGTYYLEETSAPENYDQLDKLVKFMIDDKSGSKEVQEIENRHKDDYGLPVTGGIGIWALIAAGLIAVTGSWYIYRRSRKHTL